jgi:hypothetical protein
MPLPKYESEAFEFPDEKEEREKAEANSKLEVEIEDDTPPEDRNRKPMKEPVDEVTDEELNTYDEKVQKRIKKFTRGYHDERRAKEQALREREAAEDFARKVFEDNKRLQKQLSTGSEAYIEQSKSAAQIELDAAKEKYKKAYEAADPDSIVAAQEAIARATLKIDRAESMRPIKEEEEKEFQPTREEVQQPRVSPRTQKWVEANSDWWGADEEMTMTAMGIDKRLQREYGADYVGTEEYFRTIDKTMRKRFPEHFEDAESYEDDDPPPRKRVSEPDDEDEPPRRATKPATVVAPAARSTPPGRIKLKASQVNLARKLGITPEQYAKQVAILNKGE